MGKSPKMAQISWALALNSTKTSKIKVTKVICVVFYSLSNDTSGFFYKCIDINSFIGKFKQKMCGQEPTRNSNASNIQKYTY